MAFVRYKANPHFTSEELEEISSLENVNLVLHFMGDEGCKRFSEALKTNTNLQKLYLGFNEGLLYTVRMPYVQLMYNVYIIYHIY